MSPSTIIAVPPAGCYFFSSLFHADRALPAFAFFPAPEIRPMEKTYVTG